jgi:hypothetical protein
LLLPLRLRRQLSRRLWLLLQLRLKLFLRLHVAFKSSSKAPPAAAHAQYIARDGQYEKRGGIELVESGNMPEFAQADPYAFWAAADAHERANGRTYTELQIALPRELDPAQRQELAREATRELMGERFAYTLAVHVPLAKDNIDQPHMHLMFSERIVDERTRAIPEEQFFKRNGAKKDRDTWHSREKPEQVREQWVAMMNRAMERAGQEQRLDARSWANQGREDLAALREPKLLGGEGWEAVELRQQVEELRQKREALPALHLDQAAAAAQIERKAQKDIAEVEKRRDQELSILDKLIGKAGELAVEVKERTVAAARNVVERVESFFGNKGEANVAGNVSSKAEELARPPTASIEEQLDQKVAQLDQKITVHDSIEALLANLDKRMDSDAKSKQEQEKERVKQQEPERSKGRSRDFGIGR